MLFGWNVHLAPGGTCGCRAAWLGLGSAATCLAHSSLRLWCLQEFPFGSWSWTQTQLPRASTAVLGVEQVVPRRLRALHHPAQDWGSGNTAKPFPFARLQQEIKGNPLTLGSIFPTWTGFHVSCFIPSFDPDTLWTHLKLCSQCVFAASSFHFLENTPVQLAFSYSHRGCWPEKPMYL